MIDLNPIDEEVLQLIARLEAVTERHIEDAMSQQRARQLVQEIAEYDVPGLRLAESTHSLVEQLERALPPVPDEGWRSQVWLIANDAKRQLLAGGKRVLA